MYFFNHRIAQYDGCKLSLSFTSSYIETSILSENTVTTSYNDHSLNTHNTPRDANCTATCLPSRKLYRSDEPDTPDTAGEARTSS